jgi:hypothetical protein
MMRVGTRLILVQAAVVLAALIWTAAYLAPRSPAPAPAEIRPVWSELKWPFPIDQWGTGKAFRCEARDCGTDIDVYLRAKIGFCNCTTGVADDEELERVADLDLLGERRTALAPGRPIAVRWMKGRSRPYAFSASPAEGKSIFAIAFNDHCDAIAATVVAVAKHDRPADPEAVALDFLNGDTVIHWAEATLGL